MNLNSIPAFDDNYIWILNDEAGRCLIVDPGDAEPVLNAISANNWQPEAIFLTHHHHDHVGGVKELVEKFPQIVVYGPQETQDKGTTQVVKDASTNFVPRWHRPGATQRWCFGRSIRICRRNCSKPRSETSVSKYMVHFRKNKEAVWGHRRLLLK